MKRKVLSLALVMVLSMLKEDALKPKPKSTCGVVAGIVYTEDKQTALIDRKIVHAGDTIHDVKVVRIRRDCVEFERNGNVWKQEVGQAAFWQPVKPDKRPKESILTPEPAPGLVTGVIYSNENPSAIIAGKIVYEGDVIGDAKVVKIHRDNVEFSNDSKVWRQKVREEAEAFRPSMLHQK